MDVYVTTTDKLINSSGVGFINDAVRPGQRILTGAHIALTYVSSVASGDRKVLGVGLTRLPAEIPYRRSSQLLYPRDDGVSEYPAQGPDSAAIPGIGLRAPEPLRASGDRLRHP